MSSHNPAGTPVVGQRYVEGLEAYLSPEGEQEFELAAGESVTVTGITGPIEVRAVGGWVVRVNRFSYSASVTRAR